MTYAVGRPTHRRDAPPLLTGTARFVDDIALPGVLQVAFVRSPHAHAAIRRIDVSAARALPGVHAVLTLDDLKKVLARPRMVAGPRSSSRADHLVPFVLAGDEACFVGEPVGLGVRDSRYVAEDAAPLLEIRYELLPAGAPLREGRHGRAA